MLLPIIDEIAFAATVADVVVFAFVVPVEGCSRFTTTNDNLFIGASPIPGTIFSRVLPVVVST